MPFKQVTIIGTGLIGGSLGLALRKRHLAGHVVGCDRAPVLKRAKDCGAIEAGTTNPAEAVRGSDLVVLATPVLSILDLIARLGPALPPRTLVTDVGSTKERDRAARRQIFRAQRRSTIPRRTSHGGQRTRGRRVCRRRSFRRRGLAVHAASRAKTRTPACAENFCTASKKWAPASRSSIPPSMIASAPGSAICRR